MSVEDRKKIHAAGSKPLDRVNTLIDLTRLEFSLRRLEIVTAVITKTT